MSSLQITILGCAGSFPGPGTACSGYLVQGGGVNVLLDLGPGSLANFQLHHGLDEIDAVVLTHSHPDHWVDLTGLEVASKYHLGRSGIPVYGTADNRSKVAALCEIEPTFAWHDARDGDRVEIGELLVWFSRTIHYVPTLAVRVALRGAATGMAYSADTGPGWSFTAFDAPIDLALCEATTLADAEGDNVMHLSARQAGAMAREAGVSRLVLTHLLPGGDPDAYRAEGEAAFGGPVEIARILDRYTV
jgi:ribonuclease BN (tRNA processing enzyme)